MVLEAPGVVGVMGLSRLGKRAKWARREMSERPMFGYTAPPFPMSWRWALIERAGGVLV